MSSRGSLREYQDEILKKMDEARRSADADAAMFFGFMSGQNRYLISADAISEMVPSSRLSPIPLTKRWVVGAANIRGSVCCVTDFSLMTDGEKTETGKFILFASELVVGSALLISSLCGLFTSEKLLKIEDSDVFQRENYWIDGIYGVDGNRYYLINESKLLADPRFAVLQVAV